MLLKSIYKEKMIRNSIFSLNLFFPEYHFFMLAWLILGNNYFFLCCLRRGDVKEDFWRKMIRIFIFIAIIYADFSSGRQILIFIHHSKRIEISDLGCNMQMVKLKINKEYFEGFFLALLHWLYGNWSTLVFMICRV